jgi:transcriptional regulator with XRE-family HTH domain
MKKNGISIESVNIAVGARIKKRRMAMKMTQKELGEAVGVSFQQIQKYERGINRIGAGTLYKIAHALELPTYEIFDEIPPDRPPLKERPNYQMRESTPDLVFDSLRSKYMEEAIELLDVFDRIPNIKMRKQVIELTQTFADSFIKRK